MNGPSPTLAADGHTPGAPLAPPSRQCVVCLVSLLFKKGDLRLQKDLFSGDLKCLPLCRQTDVTFVQPSLQDRPLLSSPLI